MEKQRWAGEKGGAARETREKEEEEGSRIGSESSGIRVYSFVETSLESRRRRRRSKIYSPMSLLLLLLLLRSLEKYN